MCIICILMFFCSSVLIICLHPACGGIRSLVLARDDALRAVCIIGWCVCDLFVWSDWRCVYGEYFSDDFFHRAIVAVGGGLDGADVFGEVGVGDVFEV